MGVTLPSSQPGDSLQHPETFGLGVGWAAGLCWVEATPAAKHPTMHHSNKPPRSDVLWLQTQSQP